jgi:hypothetical protein
MELIYGKWMPRFHGFLSPELRTVDKYVLVAVHTHIARPGEVWNELANLSKDDAPISGGLENSLRTMMSVRNSVPRRPQSEFQAKIDDIQQRCRLLLSLETDFSGIQDRRMALSSFFSSECSTADIRDLILSENYRLESMKKCFAISDFMQGSLEVQGIAAIIFSSLADWTHFPVLESFVRFIPDRAEAIISQFSGFMMNLVGDLQGLGVLEQFGCEICIYFVKLLLACDSSPLNSELFRMLLRLVHQVTPFALCTLLATKLDNRDAANGFPQVSQWSPEHWILASLLSDRFPPNDGIQQILFDQLEPRGGSLKTWAILWTTGFVDRPEFGEFLRTNFPDARKSPSFVRFCRKILRTDSPARQSFLSIVSAPHGLPAIQSGLLEVLWDRHHEDGLQVTLRANTHRLGSLEGSPLYFSPDLVCLIRPIQECFKSAIKKDNFDILTTVHKLLQNDDFARPFSDGISPADLGQSLSGFQDIAELRLQLDTLSTCESTPTKHHLDVMKTEVGFFSICPPFNQIVELTATLAPSTSQLMFAIVREWHGQFEILQRESLQAAGAVELFFANETAKVANAGHLVTFQIPKIRNVRFLISSPSEILFSGWSIHTHSDRPELFHPIPVHWDCDGGTLCRLSPQTLESAGLVLAGTDPAPDLMFHPILPDCEPCPPLLEIGSGFLSVSSKLHSQLKEGLIGRIRDKYSLLSFILILSSCENFHLTEEMTVQLFTHIIVNFESCDFSVLSSGKFPFSLSEPLWARDTIGNETILSTRRLKHLLNVIMQQEGFVAQLRSHLEKMIGDQSTHFPTFATPYARRQPLESDCVVFVHSFNANSKVTLHRGETEYHLPVIGPAELPGLDRVEQLFSFSLDRTTPNWIYNSPYEFLLLLKCFVHLARTKEDRYFARTVFLDAILIDSPFHRLYAEDFLFFIQNQCLFEVAEPNLVYFSKILIINRLRTTLSNPLSHLLTFEQQWFLYDSRMRAAYRELSEPDLSLLNPERPPAPPEVILRSMFSWLVHYDKVDYFPVWRMFPYWLAVNERYGNTDRNLFMGICRELIETWKPFCLEQLLAHIPANELKQPKFEQVLDFLEKDPFHPVRDPPEAEKEKKPLGAPPELVRVIALVIHHADIMFARCPDLELLLPSIRTFLRSLAVAEV